MTPGHWGQVGRGKRCPVADANNNGHPGRTPKELGG